VLHGFHAPELRPEKSRGGYVTGGVEADTAGAEIDVSGVVLTGLARMRVTSAGMGLAGDGGLFAMGVRDSSALRLTLALGVRVSPALRDVVRTLLISSAPSFLTVRAVSFSAVRTAQGATSPLDGAVVGLGGA
jgi:hypothetical protein